MTDWIALMEDHWAWLVFAALQQFDRNVSKAVCNIRRSGN